MADVVSVRDTTILKLVAPHLDYICPLLVSRLDSNFGLLYAFVDLLGVSVPALLQMQGVTRLFVAQAIALRRIDFIEFLAEKTDSSIGELLIVNIDAIFAPLYFQSPTKLSECSQMLLRLLSDNGAKGYTLQQVLTSNLPALMLEILIHAGNECDGSMKVSPNNRVRELLPPSYRSNTSDYCPLVAPRHLQEAVFSHRPVVRFLR